jgi:hypothetical protein
VNEKNLINQTNGQSEQKQNNLKLKVGAWLIWLSLIIVYPVGLILLWTLSGWSTKKKIVATFIIPIIYFIIGIVELIFLASTGIPG